VRDLPPPTGSRAAPPITAFAGTNDQLVSEESLAAWGQHTAAPFELRMFAGGHFYLRGMERELAAHIGRTLTATRQRPAA